MKVVARILLTLLALAVVGALVLGGLVAVALYDRTPLPLQDQCVARVQGESVPLDLEQARNASIIAGVSTQRGLAPRAATIALATAYQESGLRNLTYGDRDSLGLFQQRPSQGWGTQDQVLDPWFASNAFYAALVKVADWETGDVNDIAQAVQRSGHPDAYAKHVEKARRAASALTGETPASFSCVIRSPAAPDAAGLADFLGRTLPDGVAVTRTATGLRLQAPTERAAWSAAHVVVANAGSYGVRRVTVGERAWEATTLLMPEWSAGAAGRVVEVTTG